jgi:phospholipase C
VPAQANFRANNRVGDGRLDSGGQLLMIRNALGKRITRRKFAKTVGAAALGATVPGLATARTTKPTADRQNALDHVVVIMFENRSFDNVLGRLYAPGEVDSFEGVIGKDLRNPIPDWAENGADRKLIPYGIAANMNTPHPDPGEEYPHINTDLFGVGDPRNRFMPLAKMVAPYNAPAPGQQPTMDGFVADYISAFTAEKGRQPTYEEYAQIVTGYTPDQMPVTSTLARGFATFDHWFCEVPSQTFTNRSFFHAATASGFVINYPPAAAFPIHNTAETLFERLEAKGLTWRVYCDRPSPASFTGIIHASRLRTRFATNFLTVEDFLEDAARGTNYRNTFLLVAFDEAGGTYDHVAPPTAPRYVRCSNRSYASEHPGLVALTLLAGTNGSRVSAAIPVTLMEDQL